MKWATFDSFLERGSVGLPAGNFVAVGIAASSEVDLCVIGGHVLGTQRIVPYSEKCEAVRGFRVGALPSGAPASTIGQKLVLQLYECGDVLVPPGPRSPIVVSAPILGTNLGIDGNLKLRLPFSGRKQAVFCVRHNTATEAQPAKTIQVRGVRYNTREFQRVMTNEFLIDPSLEPCCIVDDAALVQVVAVSVAGAGLVQQATVFYVGGGGDLQEAFDELELYVYGNPGAVFCVGEATGERG